MDPDLETVPNQGQGGYNTGGTLNTVDQNKLNLIFGKTEHNLDTLLSKFGGDQVKEYNEIVKATQQYVSSSKPTYNYDAFNRLEKVELFNGNIQINRYDGEGLRHEMEENGRLVSFIFDSSKVVLEKTDEKTYRYVRGYELISADSEEARTYYHYCNDELGSGRWSM